MQLFVEKTEYDASGCLKAHVPFNSQSNAFKVKIKGMLRNARNENDIAKQEQLTLLIKHPKPTRIKSSLTSRSMPNSSLLM
jgi:hypothetical protein